MALLWSSIKNDVCYEVRSAGNSVRLYTDGVFHTQWNAKRPLGGHVWDLLFLSSCFYCSNDNTYQGIKNALVLGVGGGAVINSLTHFYPKVKVDGVDLDKMHLWIAKKFFLSSSKRVQLHHACAKSFVLSQDQNSTRYDLIIEDLFSGHTEFGKVEARKAVDVDEAWLLTLFERLADDGVLAINFESKRQCKQWLKPRILKSLYVVSAFKLTQPNYENVVAILCRNKTNKKMFEINWASILESFPSAETGSCRFDVSPL